MCSISPLQELDVRQARLRLILARERQHLVRHVEAVGLAGRTDALGRQQHVDAAAGAEIEDDLAGLQLRQRRRVAAPERRQQGLRGDARGLRVVVEIRGDRDPVRSSDVPQPHPALRAAPGLQRRLAVFLLNRFLDGVHRWPSL